MIKIATSVPLQSQSNQMHAKPAYAMSGEINTEVKSTADVIEAVANEYAEFSQDTLDGLTVDCGDWWFNLRPSNTEPLLRLNVEANDDVTMEKVRDEVLGLIAQ